MDKVGKYEFLAEPFHCDFSKRLFLGHLGNHLLNAADFHSTERGFGMTYLNPIHKTWVLSRLAIEMKEMPPQYSKFCVETWVEGVMRYFTDRNFKVCDAKDGNRVYGYGRSIWALIDTDTRQPQNILDIRDGGIIDYIEKEKSCPIGRLSRVPVGKNADLASSFEAKYSDIDVNGHVNSVKYIEHVLDLFDISEYKERRIARFDVAYVAESHYGDTLLFYVDKQDGDGYCVRVMKKLPSEETETEVCRCRVVFT